MRGSCLCGGVTFEAREPFTAIELCHCDKCRKAYGAAFAATLYVARESFRWRSGEARVAVYDAPLEQTPPAYRHSFCRDCGAPLPLVWSELPFVEVPVAALDGPVPTRPAYPMFACQRATWLGDPTALPWHERGAPLAQKVLQPLLAR